MIAPTYQHFRQHIEAITTKLPQNLQIIFKQCLFYTLDETIRYQSDSNTIVITGDIPAMWLRDSAAQVHPYLTFATIDPELKAMLRGVIKQQAVCILIDPYANAFKQHITDEIYHPDDQTDLHEMVWERKYELDSLSYPLWLCQKYWEQTGDTTIFDEQWKQVLETIINLWETEQNHDLRSPYRFHRPDVPAIDTLRVGKSAYTGMTWSGFRPSDDSCQYGYHIPSNMFAAVVLGYITHWLEEHYDDEPLSDRATNLRLQIIQGIQNFGIVKHPKFGDVYAYEVDGFGNHMLMDDANIPSLLALPYLGYHSKFDEIYLNTRRMILSQENPYYFTGKFAKGIGSPHTPQGWIWHLSLIMQALTATEQSEQDHLIEIILRTTADTGYMHEGFNPNNPTEYTRPWFGWANSLFAELIIQRYF